MNRIWLTGTGPEFRLKLEQALDRFGMSEDCTVGTILSVDEMLSNIVEHGYHETAGPIDIGVWKCSDEVVRVALLDRAPDTTWYSLPIACLDEKADTLAPRGRGRAIATELSRRMVHRCRPGGGNILVLDFDLQESMTHQEEQPSCQQPSPSI